MIGRAMAGIQALARAEDKLGWLRDKLSWKLFGLRHRWERRVNAAFDRRHGTDTAGEILLSAAGVPDEETERGNGIYRPLWESTFRSILRSLQVDYRDYTFVDLGSGKGKLLFLASDYPFRQIVGLEYAPLLHETAQRNVRAYRSNKQACKDITVLLVNAG